MMESISYKKIRFEPRAGADLHSLLDLECDLVDMDEQDDVSLRVEIRGEVIEIVVRE